MGRSLLRSTVLRLRNLGLVIVCVMMAVSYYLMTQRYDYELTGPESYTSRRLVSAAVHCTLYSKIGYSIAADFL